MANTLAKFLIGVPVKLKKEIRWHDLRIPVGTKGIITKVSEGPGGPYAMVKFDDGRQYGSFECWIRELEPA